MQTFQLEGKRRDHIGRNASKSARDGNMVPCVLYGDGENVHFEVANSALHHLVFTPNVYKVLVSVDGSTHETLMREIQFHPLSEKILHVDFLKLNPKKKVTTVVPIVLTGQAEGVKAGGKLIQRLRKITVRAFPQHLVDKVTVDVTDLETSKSFRIADIKIENVEILGSGSIPIATIISARALKAQAEAAAAAEAAAKTAATAATTTAATTTTAKTEEGDKEKEKEKEKEKK